MGINHEFNKFYLPTLQGKKWFDVSNVYFLLNHSVYQLGAVDHMGATQQLKNLFVARVIYPADHPRAMKHPLSQLVDYDVILI